jgi:hypothetical protein
MENIGKIEIVKCWNQLPPWGIEGANKKSRLHFATGIFYFSVGVEYFQPLHQPLKPQKHLKPLARVEDFQPLLELHHPYRLHFFTLFNL